MLHTDTFGNGDALAVDPYAVRRTEWTVEADYLYPSVNPVAEPGPDGRRPVGETFFRYRIDLPFAVWLGGANGPGRVEGRVEALVQLLTLKFGPLPDAVLTTVRGASTDQLQAWTARVLTADTLDQLPLH